MGNKILSIKNLEAGYGSLQVLFEVNMQIAGQEIAVLIGPNGAGKSTVLKGIFGLADLYKGSINFDGKDLTKVPTHDLIRMGISYVPQGRQVFSTLTVRENLEMGAFLINDKNRVRQKITDVLGHFPDLRKKLDEYAFNLSGGQQQMLAIGRALMQSPKILLLDEPSIGLSPKITKELFEKIRAINRQGVAILMVEQNARQACEIADRIFVLEDGKVALKGGKEILKKKKLRHIYLGGH